MPGPNDLTATFTLIDEVSRTLTNIDKNVEKTTDAATKNANKTAKAFVSWEQALSLLNKGLGAVKNAIREIPEVQSFFESGSDFLTNSYRNALELAGVLDRIRDATASISRSNTADATRANAEQLNLLRSIERSGFKGFDPEAIARVKAQLLDANRVLNEQQRFFNINAGFSIETIKKYQEAVKALAKEREGADKLKPSLDAVGESLATIEETVVDLPPLTVFERFKIGFDQVASQLDDIEALGADVAQAIGNSFEQFFFSAFERRTFDIADLLRGLASSFLRIISGQIGAGITSLVGQGLGSTGASNSDFQVGNVAGGSAAATAPLGRFGGGVSGGAAPIVVNINNSLIDETGVADFVGRNRDKFVAAVEEGVRRSSRVQRNIRGGRR